jgi:hypothetical protein
MTFHDPQRQDEASRIRAQLEAIKIERLRLEARLREIESEQELSPPASLAAIVTNESPAADKIALERAYRLSMLPGPEVATAFPHPEAPLTSSARLHEF